MPAPPRPRRTWLRSSACRCCHRPSPSPLYLRGCPPPDTSSPDPVAATSPTVRDSQNPRKTTARKQQQTSGKIEHARSRTFCHLRAKEKLGGLLCEGPH